MPPLRVQFIHGLEGSPQGAKARLLAEHFEARTPAMDTADFEACVALQASSLRDFEPDVLVGSSFGGAVAVAQPRPSLRNPDVTSASTSVFCFVGHKEDEMAKAAAEILSATLKTAVVVTAGIHWDNLEEAAILKIIKNSETLVDLILQKCIAEFPSIKKQE